MASATATYAPMKPTKPGFEETHEQIHKIRITLTSKNVKNLEKGTGQNAHESSSHHNKKGSLWREAEVVKQVTSITVEPGVHVEVTIADV
ncbi:hypothetical protein COLO4_11050 [Corchorus olitorius]|uniref:Ribosomal protein S10 n=1 Tax=Corchorus olitorius TaxID=93759 RepID=A0A1R3K5W9_9ROSI|nr:hypothetical protein COLO4_11050 [Corchorus olitorius]